LNLFRRRADFALGDFGMADAHNILTVKEICDLLQVHPVHGLQADKAGQDSEIPNRHGLAISKKPD
jgi:hypothetical protein